METNGKSDRFYLLGLQNHCRQWLQPWNWKKSYEQHRQHIEKQRYHFVNKGLSNQSHGFSGENWTIKKAECQRIDVFKLWCWRRLLRIPGRAGRSNQSILKEISPEYSLAGLMLKLKPQYFGHLMRRADSLEDPRCIKFSSSDRVRKFCLEIYFQFININWVLNQQH